jgi:photosystem II stability/assembly factor-like uncharacterized protein
MFKRIVYFTVPVAALIIMSYGATRAQDTWVARDSAASNPELRDAMPGRDAVYIATRSALYKATDIKEKWQSVFSLPSGGSNEITCIAGRVKAMFVGTKRGLFRSDDYGQTWKNVFRTILPDKNNITYIELSRHNRSMVVMATAKGVFISDDLGASWQDISAGLGTASIKCLALNKEYMYAGGESGLYARKLNAASWERILVRDSPDRQEASDAPSDGREDAPEPDMSIMTIALDGSRIYTGYSRYILYSDDAGKGWNGLSCDGLRGRINNILISARNRKIFCATENGVFEFDGAKNRWMEMYKGVARRVNVSRLIFGDDSEASILAVTDKGLYSFHPGDFTEGKYTDIEKSMKVLKNTFDGEPAYKELQQAAIRFCDVSPEKIKSWQRDSRIKAIIPKFSFGYDKHISNNYEIYTSATKDYVATGPDDVYKAVSASVSWDIGNLIWSDDQTNIDVRSRLMVQLRNDILDDLRRAYYERKRVQYELITNPPNEPKARLDKELRLQELTNLIDDLTGNYLSEHIKPKNPKNTDAV